MDPNVAAELKNLQFIGTATSHFQAQPWFFYPSAPSDWDWELRQNLQGHPSHIKTPQQEDELPRLLEKKAAYAQRSADIGMNMFRLSFDLPRLHAGSWDELNPGLMYAYVRFLAHLRVNGQEPMVTLHHFTMPAGLAGDSNSGAWNHPMVMKFFGKAIRNVVRFLADPDSIRRALHEHCSSDTIDRMVAEGLAKYFMIINEPMTTFGNSYLGGVFPPFKKLRIDLGFRALARMREVYPLMEETLRELGNAVPADRAPLIGNGYNWQYIAGVGSSLVHHFWQEATTRYLENAVPRSDWMGLQYYGRIRLPWAKERGDEEQGDHPGLGDAYPRGILPVLRQMHDAYPLKPILITEMGFADQEDLRRPHWLLETARYVAEAIAAGIPVQGMLYWSLADNFEWEYGMEMKMGLFSEKELGGPLVLPTEGVRSWQAWQACARVRENPTRVALAALADLKRIAKDQHDRRAAKLKLQPKK